MATKRAPKNENGFDGGFINVPVSKATRQGLHDLKDAMQVPGQAEVIERLVAMALAIQKSVGGN